MTQSVSSLDSGLDDREIVVPFPSVARICSSLLESDHTSSACHLASIQQVPGDPSMEMARPGREADHSPSSSAEVKSTWSHSSTRPYSIMASHTDNFTLSFTLLYILYFWRSQWPRVLRCRSAAARLLRSWVRIPPGAWMSVCCECCVLSGRGICDELITRPEESYRLWCVVVCDLEASKMWRSWPALGRSANRNIYIYNTLRK